MGDEDSGKAVYEGPVKCATWIHHRRHRDQKQQQQHQKVLSVVYGRWKSSTSPPIIDIFSFDPNTNSVSPSPLVKYEIDANPLGFAVHPSGDEFVCATTSGCRLFEVHREGTNFELLAKDFSSLQDVSNQKCLAFSTDGSRFATGGEDGRLRIFEWPSQNIILDELRAHKSFRDMDISLDSQFLATTSIDGSARIWKINEGVPLTSLTRNSDEKIECCRFSRDGSKPFLFCTVQKGTKMVISVWEIEGWSKIGFKSIMKKQASTLSVSLDGKYLAVGSVDGDACVVEVKKMEIRHVSRKLHLGTSISSIEFCPTERVVISTSSQWGAIITKLDVPADWKDWQIYLLLLGLFLASLVIFYILYENSDSFWNSPVGGNRPAFKKSLFTTEPQVADEQSIL